MKNRYEVSTYLGGSPVEKMLERSIWATPFPTNTLFPWKLVAPRVHLPSMSEKTDTTSPAFISNNTCESQDLIHKARSTTDFFYFREIDLWVLHFGLAMIPGAKTWAPLKTALPHWAPTTTSELSCFTGLRIWEKGKGQCDTCLTGRTVAGCMCASVLLAVCWRWTAEELDTLELVFIFNRGRGPCCAVWY